MTNAEAEYEIVPIDFEKREHKAPAFLEINTDRLTARQGSMKLGDV